MEYLQSFNDYQTTHEITQRDIIRMGVSLCGALEKCEKMNILHRDIKPENIFVSSSGEFKLGDFGVSRVLEATHAQYTSEGTFGTMAPEVYKGQPCGKEADIYSLGLVLYTLANKNCEPFIDTEKQMPSYGEINRSGMISIRRANNDHAYAILDKTGAVLHQNRKDIFFSSLSPCGNVLRVTQLSDFDYGDHYLLEVVAPDGTVISELGRAKQDALKLNEGYAGIATGAWGENSMVESSGPLSNRLIQLPYNDELYLRFTQPNGKEVKGVLNLATGELDSSRRFNSELLTGGASATSGAPAAINMGKSYIVSARGSTPLNKDFKLDNESSIVMDRKNNRINLTAGSGVKAIHQDGEGLYWVVTNSGYYYVLNPNWKTRINPPVEIGGNSTFLMNDDGLLVDDGSGVTLYNCDGEAAWSIPGVSLDSQRGGYVGSNAGGWFDLKTGEVLSIQLPASGISVLNLDV